MAATAQVSLQEYLETEFEDRAPEYVDGELAERPMTSTRHARIQSKFDRRLGAACEPKGLIVCVEIPMRVSEQRIRIADVALFDGEPGDPVAQRPPLLIVEVLSPSDTWRVLRARIRDFQQWGVAHIWLADPETRELFEVLETADARQVAVLELPEHGVRIAPDDVF
jgi:Uma2 family endonuclease